MQDSVALFDNAHGNVTAPFAALDASALSAGRVLLRRQTALGGGYMSLVPRFLLVAPEFEQTAELLLAAATRVRVGAVESGSESDRPEWIGRLTLVVEPRLGTDAVYLAASADQVDTVELGLLEGNADGPAIETEAGFVIDMTSWKIRHVCAFRPS